MDHVYIISYSMWQNIFVALYVWEHVYVPKGPVTQAEYPPECDTLRRPFEGLYVISNVSPLVECPVGVSLGPFWTANIVLTNCLQCQCISRDWEHRGTSHTLFSSLFFRGLIRGHVKWRILIINNYKATVFFLWRNLNDLHNETKAADQSYMGVTPPQHLGKHKHFQHVVLSCGDFPCITTLLVLSMSFAIYMMKPLLYQTSH